MSFQKPNIPFQSAMAPHQPSQQQNTPGSCALRLERLEQQTSTTKGELMASVAADICATFISIAKYSEEGILQGQHTGVIDKVIQTIRDTDVKQRHLLDRQVRRLRKERKWMQKKYSRLAGQADGLGRAYQAKMQRMRISLREARGEVAQLRRELDMLQASLKRSVIEGRCTPSDNIHGGFEVDMGEDVDGDYEIAESGDESKYEGDL
ncbi:uncharacterized protein N7479_001531 [Penicillium vulpinum]|uniref:Uncharacterized protein n=1 Tax=Penicillium vulpinum TaxID=29845 RepID=A0A1V6RV68_9EURO|nr:uncharacterized protein N7479_001531 [Penicillium vulpinum]KAJ5971613.1 hypothetical protein N7479_001531 [Penicillium vulpinum]OQE05488.1 hypothetical protein PENVUL_c024G04252 [Penicillium vulpinum]